MRFKLKKIMLGILIINLLLLVGCASVPSNSASNKSQNLLNTSNTNIDVGLAFLENKDTVNAKEKILLALQQAPHNPAAYYAMGYYYEVQSDIPKANTYYLKALSINPHDGASQNNYGRFLCINKHYQEAVKHFLLATQDPDYFESAAAFENAGICALQIPDKTLALALFNKAVAQDSNRQTALSEIIELNYEAKNYNLAKQYYQEYTAVFTPTSSMLQLGLKIAKALNDKKMMATILPLTMTKQQS